MSNFRMGKSIQFTSFHFNKTTCFRFCFVLFYTYTSFILILNGWIHPLFQSLENTFSGETYYWVSVVWCRKNAFSQHGNFFPALNIGDILCLRNHSGTTLGLHDNPFPDDDVTYGRLFSIAQTGAVLSLAHFVPLPPRAFTHILNTYTPCLVRNLPLKHISLVASNDPWHSDPHAQPLPF